MTKKPTLRSLSLTAGHLEHYRLAGHVIKTQEDLDIAEALLPMIDRSVGKMG